MPWWIEMKSPHQDLRRDIKSSSSSILRLFKDFVVYSVVVSSILIATFISESVSG